MRAIISKYLRRIVAGIEVTEDKQGVRDNPILKNVKPRLPGELEELQEMKSNKKTKQVLPEDRRVEHEKVNTKAPDVKPSRSEITPGKWEYGETRRQYQKEYRDEGNERYLKKNINPETDKRFKKNKGESSR